MKDYEIGLKVACYGGHDDRVILGKFIRKVDHIYNYIKWEDGISTQCNDQELQELRKLYIKNITRLGKVLYK